MIFLPPETLDEFERCIRAAGGNHAAVEGLRALRRAARRLVIEPAEDAGVFMVGDADNLRPYTPSGDGFPDLLALLAQPNRPVRASDMPGGGAARVAWQRAQRVAKHLADRVPCFVWVPGCIRHKHGSVVFDPSTSAPRIEVPVFSL